MSSGGSCRSAWMSITASPFAAARPIAIARFAPMLREKRRAFTEGSPAPRAFRTSQVPSSELLSV